MHGQVKCVPQDRKAKVMYVLCIMASTNSCLQLPAATAGTSSSVVSSLPTSDSFSLNASSASSLLSRPRRHCTGDAGGLTGESNCSNKYQTGAFSQPGLEEGGRGEGEEKATAPYPFALELAEQPPCHRLRIIEVGRNGPRRDPFAMVVPCSSPRPCSQCPIAQVGKQLVHNAVVGRAITVCLVRRLDILLPRRRSLRI
jgi:hypothetical protein